MSTGIERLSETWLPTAEQWVRDGRDQPIECLIAYYRFSRSKGWEDLPRNYREAFPKNSMSFHRLSDEHGLLIGLDGSLDGWYQLFNAFGEISDPLFHFQAGDDEHKSLDPRTRWIARLFGLAQSGILEVDVDGRRLNLEPGHHIESRSGEQTFEIHDARFYIDEFTGLPEASQKMQESADSYGWYAYMSDIRIASIAAIKWMQQKQAEIDGSVNISTETPCTESAETSCEWLSSAEQLSQQRQDQESEHEASEKKRKDANRKKAWVSHTWEQWNSAWKDAEELAINGMLDDEQESFVASCLKNLLQAVELESGIANLRLAAAYIDPDKYSNENDKKEALAVRVLTGILIDIADGAEPESVTKKLLGMKPLPPLLHGSSARQLIRAAERLPVCCERCGCVQSLSRMDLSLCSECNQSDEAENNVLPGSVSKKLATLAKKLEAFSGNRAKCRRFVLDSGLIGESKADLIQIVNDPSYASTTRKQARDLVSPLMGLTLDPEHANFIDGSTAAKRVQALLLTEPPEDANELGITNDASGSASGSSRQHHQEGISSAHAMTEQANEFAFQPISEHLPENAAIQFPSLARRFEQCERFPAHAVWLCVAKRDSGYSKKNQTAGWAKDERLTFGWNQLSTKESVEDAYKVSVHSVLPEPMSGNGQSNSSIVPNEYKELFSLATQAAELCERVELPHLDVGSTEDISGVCRWVCVLHRLFCEGLLSGPADEVIVPYPETDLKEVLFADSGTRPLRQQRFVWKIPDLARLSGDASKVLAEIASGNLVNEGSDYFTENRSWKVQLGGNAKEAQENVKDKSAANETGSKRTRTPRANDSSNGSDDTDALVSDDKTKKSSEQNIPARDDPKYCWLKSADFADRQNISTSDLANARRSSLLQFESVDKLACIDALGHPFRRTTPNGHPRYPVESSKSSKSR